MKFEDYIKLAVRTESQFNPITGIAFTRDERLLHAAMGMVTESGELIDAIKKHLFYGKPVDKVNMKEEIGDVCWYVALACDVLGIVPDAVIVGPADVLCQAMAAVYGSATCLIHSNNEDTVMVSVNQVMGSMFAICENQSFSLGEILDTNIAKLKSRYPDKFDADKAVNRDLDKERKVLEQ